MLVAMRRVVSRQFAVVGALAKQTFTRVAVQRVQHEVLEQVEERAEAKVGEIGSNPAL